MQQCLLTIVLNCFHAAWQSSVVETEILQPAKSKLPTVLSLNKKFADALVLYN